MRPRSRSERSIPLLKTIPSQSQIVLTPPDFSTPISAPKRVASSKPMTGRPPSTSSTLSSVSLSHSPASSRSESPVTPVSLSFSPDNSRHRRQSSHQYRRHRTHHDRDSKLPLSSSCPPSKSILTRTSSVSTKDSSHTVNKSVKFAAIPIVHYASTGYWDLETVDATADVHSGTMGINVESMDMDDPFANYRSRDLSADSEESESLYHEQGSRLGSLDMARLRELQCTTPTPEREKEKAKGLKRLMSLSRKPVSTTGTTTTSVVTTSHKSSSHSATSSTRGRPIISTPYALGAYPTHAGVSTISLHSSHQSGRGVAPDLIPEEPLPRIRTAPSTESFRSAKSAAARSVRSMGSVKSNSSTRGFRTWIGRTMGWMES